MRSLDGRKNDITPVTDDGVELRCEGAHHQAPHSGMRGGTESAASSIPRGNPVRA